MRYRRVLEPLLRALRGPPRRRAQIPASRRRRRSALPEHAGRRDPCGLGATSALSAPLHWGEIGPHRIWQAVHERMAWQGASERSANKFLSELIWREFAHHLLFHYPDLPDTNWRAGGRWPPASRCRKPGFSIRRKTGRSGRGKAARIRT